MSRRVAARTGERGVRLPLGWVLDGGDQVVITDNEWNLILADTATLNRLDDLGTTISPVDPVPTWRDMQRGLGGGGGSGSPGANGLSAYQIAVANGFVGTEAAWVASLHDTGFFMEVNFASPSTTWTITHNQGTYGIEVLTFDGSGNPTLGAVSYPDPNTAVVAWSVPMSGKARAFR